MKYLSLILLFTITAFSLFAQQIPPNWDLTPPQDTAAFKYSVGISQPEPTEQAALDGAWRNALQNFASSITTRVESLTDITVSEQGRDSDIADAYTVLVETSSFSTQVPLTGVRELARKSAPQNGRYVARILAVMSAADYQKAVHAVDNEEAAYLAYRFFAQKVSGITRLGGKSPAGYPDFYTWLRNTCVTISFTDDRSAAPYLEQTELFCKKLYRTITTFAETIDGVPARIMYDSPRYYDGILRTLQNFGMFRIERENSALRLTPTSSSSLNDFRTAVANMKDASKIFVTGIEVIQTENGSILNTANLVVNQFKTLAARQFNLNAVNFNLPPRYTNNPFLDEAAIVDYINKNSRDFPARFVALVTADTKLEQAIPEYKIPPLVTATARFTLYDVLTGETISSDTVDTRGFAFSPPNTQDQSVLTESRRALQFLYDAKNQPGLAGIMKELLGKL
ncbi:hypothetical protein FACS1894137_00280 [Spirochaetia bacterium]|nr:hypothetical protein FACS1894137_00280 [Spirochaetia bacterium]